MRACARSPRPARRRGAANSASTWSPPAAPSPLPSYPACCGGRRVEGARRLRGLVRRHAEVRRRRDERHRRARVLHVPPDGELDGHDPLAHPRAPRRRRPRRHSGTSRYNQIPAVQYGPWSSVYSSTNPAFAGGPIKLVGTVSDVFSNGAASSPAHKLMPAFVWTGNQTLAGQAAELYRVYVFSDKQCLNQRLHRLRHRQPGVRAAAVRVADASRLRLPASRLARFNYLGDGTEPKGFMNDWTGAHAERGPAARAAAVRGGRHAGRRRRRLLVFGSSSSSGGSGGGSAGTVTWTGDFGAPVDLWDTDWPSSGYYWTVVPVAAVLARARSRRRSCLRARRRTRPRSRSRAPPASTSATRSRSAAGRTRSPRSSPASRPVR